MMPSAMLIHHPPFSCTICPGSVGPTEHRTYIYRCAWLYQKNPKNVNTNAKKSTLYTEHHLSAYSISVFFFQPTITGKRVYHSYISSAITPLLVCDANAIVSIAYKACVVQLAQHQTLNLYSKKRPFYKSFFLAHHQVLKNVQHIPPPF